MNLDVWSEIETAIRTNLATVWAHRTPDSATIRALAGKYRVDPHDVANMAHAAKTRGEFPRPGPEPAQARVEKARALADAAKAKAAAEAAPPVVIDQPEHECWECGHIANSRNSLTMHGQRHSHRIDQPPAHPLQCPHCDYRAKKSRGLAIHIGRSHKTDPPAADTAPEAEPVVVLSVDGPTPPSTLAANPINTIGGYVAPAAPADAAADPVLDEREVAESFDLADAPTDPEPADETPEDAAVPGDNRRLCDQALAAVAGIPGDNPPEPVETQARRALAELELLQDVIRDQALNEALIAELAVLKARVAEIEQALAPVTDGHDEEEAA